MHTKNVTALATTLFLSLVAAEPLPDDQFTVPGIGFETCLVRWWGSPGSKMTRPIYRMAHFDTDVFELHYGIVPGRELANYTMPYWPIRSFLSFVDAPMEVAQQVSLTYHDSAGEHAAGFVPRSGVEMAAQGDALAVRIRNRAITTPEDVTLVADKNLGEGNPLSLEQTFLLHKGARTVPVRCVLKNVGGTDLHDASITLTYEQSSGWNRFGVAETDAYRPLGVAATGGAKAFYAFSESMGRGVAIAAGEECSLTYHFLPETNEWRVTISFAARELCAKAVRRFNYTVRTLRAPPENLGANTDELDLSGLQFTRVQPASFKTAPVDTATRVTIADQVADIDRPKVRGLNLRAGFPQAFDDLETLRDWGCNQIIASQGDPGKTAQLIERGHALGMEMLLTGRGTYKDGSPQFDAYYAAPRQPEQIPDSHGQDEDHYYWDHIQPSRTFEDVYAKPLSQATHDEKVTYWARCFADKWLAVRDAVRPHAPDAGLWFYAPFPSVAHVDPLDNYDPFMKMLADELGQALTVFPFYYGIEHNQAEYMMRRWKDAGAARAVFLPMRDFMTKPSQFIRSITSARRGGADGTCGFNFSVGDAAPEDQWQWKAIMLGAWANFPTPDLPAFCLIEEPAELVELMAEPGLSVRIDSRVDGFDGRAALAPVFEEPFAARVAANPSAANEITVVISSDLPRAVGQAGKGALTMHGRTLRISGGTPQALQGACALLLRFAELACNERD